MPTQSTKDAGTPVSSAGKTKARETKKTRSPEMGQTVPGQTLTGDGRIGTDTPAGDEPVGDKIKAKAKQGAKAVGSRAETLASVGMGQAEQSLRSLSRALDASRESMHDEGGGVLEGPMGDVQQRIERVADRLGRAEPRELVGDVERYARRNPWMFIGACLLGGVAAARFLKASGSSDYRARPDHARTDRALPAPMGGPMDGERRLTDGAL